MATSSTLKALKEEDGPDAPREQPAPARASGLAGRLLTWRQSIWRRRWLSVTTAWLICLAGWALIALWPTSYNASAVIYANLAELTGEETAADALDRTPVVRLQSMLLSDDALDDVRNAVQLTPERKQSLGDDLFLGSTMPPLFVLTYEHDDPAIAQQILEAVIATFQNRMDEIAAASVEVAEALDLEVDDQERRLQTAEADLVAFRRSNADHLNGAEARAAELALLEEEVRSLEKQAAAAINERDGIAAKLAKLVETDAGESQPPRSLDVVEAEQNALETELAKLRDRYADSHPYVVAVLDAVKTLQTEALALAPSGDDTGAADEVPLDPATLEQLHGELIVRVSELNSRLTDKRRQIELLQALTRTTTSVEAELAGLESEKKELQAAFAALQQHRDELDNDVGGEADQEAFRLIKRPELPTDPVGPSRLMALAAVLLGGVGLGAIAAVFWNRYKGVFESAWQLKQRFDVGVLGTISEVLTPEDRKRLDYSRMAFGLACLALIGAFSGLAIAELTDSLTPLGDQLRARLLG